MASLWKIVYYKDAQTQHDQYTGNAREFMDLCLNAIAVNPKGAKGVTRIGDSYLFARKDTGGKWKGWKAGIKYTIHDREVTITVLRIHIEK